ncbi:MAG: hypothetical protein KGL95_15370, partial [Patescibacteria group bacterium]|nr:hypothetical protein [Patescibacteria group bacterium]
MFRVKKLFAIIIFIILTVTVVFSAAYAQKTPAIDLTISPTVLELVATPGDTLTQKFRVRNNGSQATTLGITVDKLTVQDGQITPTNPTPADDFMSWISFDKKTFSANPKEWTDVSITLTIPKSAAFGYYYALRIEPITATESANTPAAKLIGQIVLPVLLTVRSPGAKSEVQLLNFQTPSLVEYLPAVFSVTIKNTGNVHVKPRGNIFIQGPGNVDLGTLDINPTFGIVLPGATRTFQSTWDDGFLVQEPVIEDDGAVKTDTAGKPVTHLVINWDKLTHFRIGKYSASALVVYDNGKRDVPLEQTVTFWVFPYKLIGAIVVSLLVI